MYQHWSPADRRVRSCSFDVVGRSKSRSGGKPPLLLTAVFTPHHAIQMEDSYALEIIGDVKEYRDASIQHVPEALKSDAVNLVGSFVAIYGSTPLFVTCTCLQLEN